MTQNTCPGCLHHYVDSLFFSAAVLLDFTLAQIGGMSFPYGYRSWFPVYFETNRTQRRYAWAGSMRRNETMDKIDIVKAYFAALDSTSMENVHQYLSEDYQLVDFTPQPMDKDAMLDMVKQFKAALPNMSHSLSNIRIEDNVVRLTVQCSGTNSGHLDLRQMGIGIFPRTQKFIIFPNGNYEFTIKDEKISRERDVSPISPNRRMSGILRAFGVDAAFQ